MANSNKKRIVIGVIFAFLILSYAGIKLYSSIIENEKIEESINKEYKELFITDSINSKVLSTYYPEHWRGGKDIQNVKLKDGRNYVISIRTNLTDKEKYFGDLVKPGVLLRKNLGSDTLTLIKNEKIYQYLIFK